MYTNLKIFLVDDDPFSIGLLKQQLMQMGLNDINTFSSGQELLDNLAKKPDLIFLDYHLDDFKGEDLLHKIKECNPQTKVIMVSGQTRMDIALNLLNSGAFDYIIKDENITTKISQSIYKILSILEYRKRNIGNEVEEERKEKDNLKIILDAQEKIRNEISSELHDNVNQLLAASKMYIESAKKDEVNRVELLDESKVILQSAMDEIRKMSHNLNSVFIKNVDLKKELSQLLTQLKTQHNFEFTANIQLDDIENYLTPQKQHEIFRILQEQVNNIVKYAKAKHVSVGVYFKNEELIVEVKDDGIGFDLAEVKRGIGLSSIFSRIQNVNGKHSIKTAPNKGCLWVIQIPVSYICKSKLLNAV